jgi:hypothetical protein
MGTQRVQMKGVLPWLVRWARRAVTRDFNLVLAALVSPVQNIFSLTVDLVFQFMCPHRPAKPGQAVVQGRLSLNACLRSHPLDICRKPDQASCGASCDAYEAGE